MIVIFFLSKSQKTPGPGYVKTTIVHFNSNFHCSLRRPFNERRRFPGEISLPLSNSLKASSYEPGNRRILWCVHMGNFGPVERDE